MEANLRLTLKKNPSQAHLLVNIGQMRMDLIEHDNASTCTSDDIGASVPTWREEHEWLPDILACIIVADLQDVPTH